MKSKLLKFTLAVFASLGMTTLALAPATFAADSSICDIPGITQEAKEAAGCSGTSTNDFSDTIANILRAIIGVAGLVATIFIVIGGWHYMTSAGDAGKLKKAKDTILYACIGLVVCALSFVIVNWAVSIINDPAGSVPESSEGTDASGDTSAGTSSES